MLTVKMLKEMREALDEATNTETVELDLPYEYIDMIYDQVIDKYQLSDGFDIRTALSVFVTETVQDYINESKESKSTT
jgi:hypothetical protein